MQDLDDVSDYLILKLSETSEDKIISFLKFNKLLYYCQAWHLAIHHEPLFKARFEPWIHGPICREIWDNKNITSIYGAIHLEDNKSKQENIDQEKIKFIDEVLEAYKGWTDWSLEDQIKHEAPYIRAREGLNPNAQCHNMIKEKDMEIYYGFQIAYQNAQREEDQKLFDFIPQV